MDVEQIRTVASTYSQHTGLKLSTLGAYAVNDGKFFSRLERGGDCRSRTFKKVMAFFAETWPADLEWPSDIPRPTTEKKEAA